MKQEPLYINGKPMPFTAEELGVVLKVVKKSILSAEKQMTKEDEEKILDHLLEELENI